MKRLARLGRVVLAALLLAAAQISLEHPLEHLGEPADELACELCVASTGHGHALAGEAKLPAIVPALRASADAESHPFLAAFEPHYRSHAPPSLL